MDDSYELIIVPLDGSALAEGAIPFAIALAQRSGSRVELVHVHYQEVPVTVVDTRWEDDRAAEMGSAISAVAERLTAETGLDISAVTLRGAVAPSLVQHAVDRSADLIVMTTHGRSGFSHAWFGSVAESVIHSATTPVLVVRAHDQARTPVTEPLFHHVLLPIDREASGAEARQRALTLGTHRYTAYTLLTVVSAMPVQPPSPIGGSLFADADLARQ